MITNSDYKEILKIAYELAEKSPDPSTQNGAILVREAGISGYEIMSRGYNHFPEGVKYLSERWERPIKYSFIEHAERDSIFQAAKMGISTQGLIMVCSWSACDNCARAIIGSGIKRLVRHKQASDRSPENWKQNIVIADMMLREAGIEIIDYDGIIGGLSIRHSGQTWNP